MKARRSVVVAVLLLALLLTPSVVFAAESPLELRMWIYALGPHPAAWMPVIEGFNATNDRIQIKAEVFPDLEEKISAAFATKSAPDIVLGDPTSFSRLITNGLVVPIDKLGVITEEVAHDMFFEGLLQAFSRDGVLYALPVESGCCKIDCVNS